MFFKLDTLQTPQDIPMTLSRHPTDTLQSNSRHPSYLLQTPIRHPPNIEYGGPFLQVEARQGFNTLLGYVVIVREKVEIQFGQLDQRGIWQQC